MNKRMIFILFVFAMSHLHACVNLEPSKIKSELEDWSGFCDHFKQQSKILKPFFGCPTIEKFVYSEDASKEEVVNAVNELLYLQMVSTIQERGVSLFIDRFEGDFYSTWRLIQEIAAEENDFAEDVEDQFYDLAAVLKDTFMTEITPAISIYYDENAFWHGSQSGEPEPAEALALINTEEKSVYVYRIGYYWGDMKNTNQN